MPYFFTTLLSRIKPCRKNVGNNKSKLYTVLASQIYGIIKVDLDAGTPLTFAELVKDVDEAYQLYLKDKADAEADATT